MNDGRGESDCGGEIKWNSTRPYQMGQT